MKKYLNLKMNNIMKKNLLFMLLMITYLLCSASVISCNSKSNGSNDNVTSDSVGATNPSVDTAAVKKRVTEILSEGMPMSDIDAVKKFFSKEFSELYLKIYNYEEENLFPGEIGFFECTVWRNQCGEDTGIFKHHVIKDLKLIDESTVLVTVDFVYKSYFEGEKDIMKPIKYQLVYENENWLIDDVTRDEYSSKKEMEEYVKKLSKKQNPYVGRIYKGGGNGAGLGIDMTITFLANNKCICVSDWYRAFSTPKTVNGTYEVKNKKVIVRYKLDYDGEFVFNVHEKGRVLSFNNSDENMGGTLGNDFMSIEYYGETEN